jgi:hypothetical protein
LVYEILCKFLSQSFINEPTSDTGIAGRGSDCGVFFKEERYGHMFIDNRVRRFSDDFGPPEPGRENSGRASEYDYTRGSQRLLQLRRQEANLHLNCGLLGIHVGRLLGVRLLVGAGYRYVLGFYKIYNEVSIVFSTGRQIFNSISLDL